MDFSKSMKIKALYLFSCSRTELFAVFISAFYLSAAQLRLWLVSSEKIVARLQTAAPVSESDFLLPLKSLKTSRLVSLVEAVDRNLFKPSCLRRALALSSVCRRLGQNPDFRIGVRRDGDALLAHCWLELDGLKMEIQDPGFSYSMLA